MDIRLTICVVVLLTYFNGQVQSQSPNFRDQFQYRGNGPCPTVTTMANFDQERYYGRWYENSKYPVPYEWGQRCQTAVYTPFSGIFRGYTKVVNEAVYDGPYADDLNLQEVRVYGWATQPGSATGKLRVNFWTAWTGGDYWILDTDYDNYAAVHSCYEEGSTHIMANWILTRVPEPESMTVQIAQAVFTGFGIDLDEFVETDRTECTDVYNNQDLYPRAP